MTLRMLTVPFQVRAGVWAYLTLPTDLTPKEADRIVACLYAWAMDPFVRAQLLPLVAQRTWSLFGLWARLETDAFMREVRGL